MTKFLKFIPFLLLLLSCSQEPMFYAITQEIELEEPNVIGNANSIVKLKGDLYTQNGNVYKKPVGTVRGWVQITAPGGVVALASDEVNLYALTANQTDDEGYAHTYQVYVLVNGNGDWQKISGVSKDIVTEEGAVYVNAIALFDNGVVGESDNTTNRAAYVRIDSTVKKLNGTSATDLTTQPTNASSIIAAANLGGKDCFSSTRSFCSNGTDTLYSVIDGNVKTSSNNVDWIDSAVGVTDATVMEYATDKLYVGTSLGLQQIMLNAVGGTPSSVTNLGSNAEATTGEKEITEVAFFGSVDNDAIYAGAIEQYNTRNNGLWGYYPARGNWNLE